MKSSYKLVISAFFVTVIGSFIWSANHYYSKYQYEKERADEAVQSAKLATAITSNILQSLQIVNTVLEANQHAKQQIALKSQRIQEDIRMAVVDDDCASRPVLAAAADRLRKYVDSLRTSSGNTATGKSDRWNPATSHSRSADLWRQSGFECESVVSTD